MTAGLLHIASLPSSSTTFTLASSVVNGVFETLWPTRCAVCDKPGTLLCERCKARLDYIDRWRACPRCGAPYGLVQCTECTPAALERFGSSDLPYDACASAVVLDDAARRMAILYKDAGERRLAKTLGAITASAADPAWFRDAIAVTWVPASRTAFRQRGFDHAEDLARAIVEHEVASGAIAKPPLLVGLLKRPDAHDQRSLSRRERIANVSGRFSQAKQAIMPESIIVVDDVYTTGATLFAAAATLRTAGAATIRCLTFARTL